MSSGKFNMNLRFLFVYGTLKFSHNGNMSKWLQSTGTTRISDNASVLGTVRDLGSFPGAKFNDPLQTKDDTRIIGELLMFPEDNVKIIERLDQYEGVGSGLYAKRVVDVRIPGHDFDIEALAYEYTGS